MIHFFLIVIFSVWGPDGPVDVYITDEVDEICGHYQVNGCLLDIGIITEDPFRFDERGCNTLTHEWLHLYIPNEADLPYCIQDQEFRK